MKRACVIGWPINHSRSPLIHGYWIRAYGLDASYTRVPVEPHDLVSFIRNLAANGYVGCNVTLPYKERVYDLVTSADELTGDLHAVNTIYVRDHKLYGTNTDGEGYIRSLQSQVPELPLRNSKVVVLGAGGATASIIHIILQQGVSEILVANRSRERSEALAKRFGNPVRDILWDRRSESLADAQLLINTTSLGMTGQPPLDIDLARLPSHAVVSDIVYTPLRTALLQDAQRRGYRTAEGLGMLLHQAVRGFELWFGIRPVVTQELYDIVARDVDPDYAR